MTRTWVFMLLLFLAPVQALPAEEASSEAAATDDDTSLSRLILMDRLYSVVMPTNWHYDIDAHTGSVTFFEQEGSPNHLLITIPNPNIKGEIQDAVAKYLDYFRATYKMDVETLVTDASVYGDYPSYTVGFAAPNSEEATYTGIINAIDIKGYGVVFMAISSTDEYDAFMEAASGIMDSYSVNEGIMRSRARQLAAFGDVLAQHLDAALTATPDKK